MTITTEQFEQATAELDALQAETEFLPMMAADDAAEVEVETVQTDDDIGGTHETVH